MKERGENGRARHGNTASGKGGCSQATLADSQRRAQTLLNAVETPQCSDSPFRHCLSPGLLIVGALPWSSTFKRGAEASAPWTAPIPPPHLLRVQSPHREPHHQRECQRCASRCPTRLRPSEVAASTVHGAKCCAGCEEWTATSVLGQATRTASHGQRTLSSTNYSHIAALPTSICQQPDRGRRGGLPRIRPRVRLTPAPSPPPPPPPPCSLPRKEDQSAASREGIVAPLPRHHASRWRRSSRAPARLATIGRLGVTYGWRPPAQHIT